MDRFTVESDSGVFYIRDNGWIGSDCPKDMYPKSAIELQFRGRSRANTVCNLLNAEWQEFQLNPR